jgi:hypothetical protein
MFLTARPMCDTIISQHRPHGLTTHAAMVGIEHTPEKRFRWHWPSVVGVTSRPRVVFGANVT